LIAQEGKTAEEWEDQAAKLRQKDTDPPAWLRAGARWAKKGEEVHFGYKNHVKVDEKSKLIEKYEVTDASVHDSQKIEDLVEKGDGRVHGDSAYRSAQIEKDRKEKAVESRIHEQGYRNRPLTEEQKENNRQKSRVRARIEHVFGYMTNSMGGIFLTCIGMRRTTAAIGLMNLIYNMARYEQLMRLANSS
jgi:IS5 family transposase